MRASPSSALRLAHDRWAWPAVKAGERRTFVVGLPHRLHALKHVINAMRELHIRSLSATAEWEQQHRSKSDRTWSI
jgi:hypothetical protein